MLSKYACNCTKLMIQHNQEMTKNSHHNRVGSGKGLEIRETDLMGKLTIVGFFSTKKLFLVNLCGRGRHGVRGQGEVGGANLDTDDEVRREFR